MWEGTQENSEKLSTATKDLIRICCRMVIDTRQDKIEVFELSKIINQRKFDNIRKYKMKMIKETLKKGNK